MRVSLVKNIARSTLAGVSPAKEVYLGQRGKNTVHTCK